MNSNDSSSFFYGKQIDAIDSLKEWNLWGRQGRENVEEFLYQQDYKALAQDVAWRIWSSRAVCE